jgi:alkanesulfonate monooxygenase SsuD/methylene tetrahydromethanopterin reductase-like flavin-dependent oxidoreductase (luciferase family)
MKFGLLMVIRNPDEWRRPEHEVYQAHINRIVMGEKLGFTHAWTSEHHFTSGGWSPSQFLILSAIAQRTEHIRLGTYILVAPFHNPVRAAEDAATVDILSNGRFDLGIGPGSDPREFAAFGVPFKERRPRMYECLDIMKKCFYEDTFSFKGRFWEFNNVRMTTKPVQKQIPVYVAAIGEKALAEAGSQGYHLAGGGPPDQHGIYQAALRKAGHDPKNFHRIGLHLGHIAETTEKAWDQSERYLHYYVTYMVGMINAQRAVGPKSVVNVDTVLTVPPVGELRKAGAGPYGKAYIGSPEDVIKMIEEELKVNPLTEIGWSEGLPGQDPRDADRSVELFAKEVMPHFKNR